MDGTNLRSAWRKWYDAEVHSTTNRYDHLVKNGQIVEQDEDIIEVAGFRTIPLNELESVTGDLADAIENYPLLSSSGLRLVHADFSFRNVIIDDGVLRIGAILDWDEAMILPLDLVPQCPQDLCDRSGLDLPIALQTDLLYGKGVINKMQDVFASLRSMRPPAVAAEDRTHEDTYINICELNGLSIAFEDAYIKDLYVHALNFYNDQLPLELWERTRLAKAIHSLIKAGFLWWTRNRRWISSLSAQDD